MYIILYNFWDVYGSDFFACLKLIFNKVIAFHSSTCK